ncbi:aldehyde dehydrogenase family protein, partial [Burkholderia cenocepacia]
MNAAVPQTTLALPTAKLLIDGAFVDSRSAEWGDIVNPATQEVIGRVPYATLDEVDAAIASAQRAFQTWKTTPIGARLRIMLKFQDLVRRNLERIAHTLTAEQGKTLPDAQGDIFRGLEVVEHACSIGTLQQGEFAENVAGGV